MDDNFMHIKIPQKWQTSTQLISRVNNLVYYCLLNFILVNQNLSIVKSQEYLTTDVPVYQ